MERGFVKVYRKILDGVVFSDSNLFQLFMYLLMTANHKEGFAYTQKIDSGQLLTGRKVLARELKTSESAIQRRLTKLEKLGLITQKTNNKNRIITVVGYSQFNSYDSREQQANNKRTTSEQQANTNNNANNANNANKGEGHRFAPPTIEEINTYILEKGYRFVDGNIFFNHYESNGWKVGKNKMKDWKRALANWEARDKKESEAKNNERRNGKGYGVNKSELESLLASKRKQSNREPNTNTGVFIGSNEQGQEYSAS